MLVPMQLATYRGIIEDSLHSRTACNTLSNAKTAAMRSDDYTKLHLALQQQLVASFAALIAARNLKIRDCKTQRSPIGATSSENQHRQKRRHRDGSVFMFVWKREQAQKATSGASEHVMPRKLAPRTNALPRAFYDR